MERTDLKKIYISLALWALLLSAVYSRISNLNYNSPFNDEAIYIVVGKLGVYKHDWYSFNAASWMAGSPYVYPVVAALSYSWGGIEATRFLSVTFNLVTCVSIFFITKKVYLKTVTHFRKKAEIRANVAGLFSAVIVCFSSVSYYVSRLATYDSLSYMFLFLGVAFLLEAEDMTESTPKQYLLSAIFFYFAVLTKITVAVYAPFIFAYSLMEPFSSKYSKWGSSKLLRFWKGYFLFPAIVLIVIYAFGNIVSIESYLVSQVGREEPPYTRVLGDFINNAKWEAIALSVSLLLLSSTKILKAWLSFTLLSVIILLAHLATHRVATLDKHSFLFIAFASVSIGISFSGFIYRFNRRTSQAVASLVVLVLFSAFSFLSVKEYAKYNTLWADSTILMKYIKDEVRPGNKILTEVGPSVMLAAYDVSGPLNTTTFDWFKYKDLTGDYAYVSAVSEGYFDYIQLNSNQRPKNPIYQDVHDLVWSNLSDQYALSFKEDEFYVYKKQN